MTVIFACLFVCLLFAVATQLPAYFATSVNAKAMISDTKAPLEGTSDVKAEELLVKEVKDVTAQMKILRKWLSEAPLYKDLLQVVGERPSGVAITALVYQRGNSSVVISGIAKKRDDLLFFVDALEKSKTFSAVDLPVSSLAQQEKVNFSITVTFKTL